MKLVHYADDIKDIHYDAGQIYYITGSTLYAFDLTRLRASHQLSFNLVGETNMCIVALGKHPVAVNYM